MESPSDTTVAPNYLQLYLQDRHIPCPTCKYDLYALTQPLCPNCHTELRLGVASVTPFRLPWAVLVAFLSINGTIGLFFIILMLKIGLPNDEKWFLPLGLFIAAIILVPLVVALRRRIYRCSHLLQWTLAIAGLVYTLTAFGSMIHAI